MRRRRALGWKRLVLVGIGVVIVLFALAQAVPYGRAHTNPPVVAEPQWNSALTRSLVVSSCYDCHSNLTRWPWYSNVAPMSWLVQHDVDEGRSVLNFSEWDRFQLSPEEVAEAVAEGEMPPRQYTLLHGGLSDKERAELVAGIRASLGP